MSVPDIAYQIRYVCTGHGLALQLSARDFGFLALISGSPVLGFGFLSLISDSGM